MFDGLVPVEESARYFAAITQASFTRTESARPEAEFRHWVCEMPLENLPRTSLWPATEAAVAAVRPGERFLPYRVYTNFASFGDTLLTHVDAVADGARADRALVSVRETGTTEWGGETLFYDRRRRRAAGGESAARRACCCSMAPSATPASRRTAIARWRATPSPSSCAPLTSRGSS